MRLTDMARKGLEEIQALSKSNKVKQSQSQTKSMRTSVLFPEIVKCEQMFYYNFYGEQVFGVGERWSPHYLHYFTARAYVRSFH